MQVSHRLSADSIYRYLSYIYPVSRPEPEDSRSDSIEKYRSLTIVTVDLHKGDGTSFRGTSSRGTSKNNRYKNPSTKLKETVPY